MKANLILTKISLKMNITFLPYTTTRASRDLHCGLNTPPQNSTLYVNIGISPSWYLVTTSPSTVS
jgi:hypothetical protein